VSVDWTPRFFSISTLNGDGNDLCWTRFRKYGNNCALFWNWRQMTETAAFTILPVEAICVAEVGGVGSWVKKEGKLQRANIHCLEELASFNWKRLKPVVTVDSRTTNNCMGRDSVVGIATCFGLNCPGIKSRWGRDILHPSRLVLGPTHTPKNTSSGSFPGSKLAGTWSWQPTPFSTEVIKERLGLYPYSPSRPSLPVLGWTSPLSFNQQKHNICNT
jgi:hypothetical protein